MQRGRGRPKDEAKREAVLDAARALFLRHGADGVSLDSVIHAAGVSKANFYSNFADRAALLEAVIRREAERVIRSDEPAGGSGSIETDLASFGFRLLRLLTDHDLIGFEHLIGTAGQARPELAERFFLAGPGRTFDALVARIALGMREGSLRPDAARQAAEDLVGLWQGFMRVELSMTLRPKPGLQALEARAARGVRVFMKLYGTPPSVPLKDGTVCI